MSLDRKQLYVYDLDAKLKESLELIYFDSLTQESVQITEPIENDIERNETRSPQSERDPSYYKSDLYRFNLKRSLNNLEPLNEEEFESLLENQSIDSLSGSDSEVENEVESKDPYHDSELKLQALMKKISIEKEETNEEITVSYLNTKSPYILLKTPMIPNEMALAVYKGLFHEKDLLQKPMETLKNMSSLKNGKSALFMIGGGHFAAAIISHLPKDTKGNAPSAKGSLIEQSVNVIVLKTFHRYTVRRKQGGSQSASDNARGKANSAGSSIRRYNEQALIKEVRELLDQWRLHLNECSTVFIRANGASNRKILVGYEGAVLKNNDKRLRNFPFTTKRATASELKRAWVELTYLKSVDLPKIKEKAKKKVDTKSSLSSPVPEIVRDPKEVENDNHTSELISLLRKQKAPKLLSFLKSNKLDVNTFKLSPETKYANTPSLLHFAAANELTHIIHILMNNLKADPTSLNIFGRTPVEVTSDASVRKAFQIARFKLGEDFCDWKKSNVGPAKSKEVFDKEEADEKERIKTEKQNLIKEELSKKTEMELRKPKISSNGTVGGMPNAQYDLSGLSEQQKMRLMREQRARAAEARLVQSVNRL